MINSTTESYKKDKYGSIVGTRIDGLNKNQDQQLKIKGTIWTNKKRFH